MADPITRDPGVLPVIAKGNSSHVIVRDPSKAGTADELARVAAAEFESAGAATAVQGALTAHIALSNPHNTGIAHISGLQAALDGKSASVHTHVIGDTTGLQAALDGKAATGHTHVIGDTTGLQAALDLKLEAGDLPDLSGLPTFEAQSTSSTLSNAMHGQFVDVSGSTMVLPTTLKDGFTCIIRSTNNLGVVLTTTATNLEDPFGTDLPTAREVSKGQLVMLVYRQSTSTWVVSDVSPAAYDGTVLSITQTSFNRLPQVGAGIFVRIDYSGTPSSIVLSQAAIPGRKWFCYLHNTGPNALTIEDGDCTIRNGLYDLVTSYVLPVGGTIRMEVADASEWIIDEIHVPAGSGVTDHGALTGLADDDHTQYHNDTRGDVRYNTKAEITTLLSAKATDTAVFHKATAAEISALTEKVSPVSGDHILIEDSAAGNAKKRVQIGNLPGGSGTDADAIHDNVSGEIAALTLKATPVSGDLLLIEDSADTNSKKKITLGSLPPPTAQELGGRPIYNALTDGGIVADYVDRLNPGTDQRAAIIAWIETNGLPAGKRRFFFPPGHYRIDEGSGNATTVLDIRGYDDVEIFGVPGETFFHSPQSLDLKYKNNPFIRVGWLQDARRVRISGLAFVNDPYLTNSEASDSDNGLQWGWLHAPPWIASTTREKGDKRHSLDRAYIIEYLGDGTASATEPTWAPGAMTDNGISVNVKPVALWQASTSYAQYDYAWFTTGDGPTGNKHVIHGVSYDSLAMLMTPGASQTSGTVEPTLSKPSIDGARGNPGDDNYWNWIGLVDKSAECVIEDCIFRGTAGFTEAGGNSISINSGNGIDGYGYHLIRRNVFEDYQYGTSVVGYYHFCTFSDNIYRRTAGWHNCYGTYNAHDHYCQGGGNVWINEKFDRHYSGLPIKIHANVSNVPLIGNKIIGCDFRNYGDWGVAVLDPDTYVTNHPNFIPQATSGSWLSANPTSSTTIVGCHFQIEKEAYDNWNPYGYPGGTPNSQFAIESGGVGTVVSGCTFMDTNGITSKTETETDYDGVATGLLVTGCSFRSIYRQGLALQGPVKVTNCEFDYRALASVSTGVRLNSYAELRDSRIFVRAGVQDSRDNHVLTIYGKRVVVDNVTVSSDGIGSIFGSDGTNTTDCVIRNCRFLAPNGSLYWNPESNGMDGWLFEGNYWHINGWAYLRNMGAQEGLRFVNERGNLWTNGGGALLTGLGCGVVELVPTSVNRGSTERYHLVDTDGARVSDPANIRGISLVAPINATVYGALIGTSIGAVLPLQMTGQVTAGDYVRLSATLGEAETAGTTGSTTKPTSGFIGLVRGVGTAGAGAGVALVEVLAWNRPDPTGGSVVPYSGTSDPGVNDDNTQGHVAGITGVNTTTGDMFICLDATTGAAVWQRI